MYQGFFWAGRRGGGSDPLPPLGEHGGDINSYQKYQAKKKKAAWSAAKEKYLSQQTHFLKSVFGIWFCLWQKWRPAIRNLHDSAGRGELCAWTTLKNCAPMHDIMLNSQVDIVTKRFGHDQFFREFLPNKNKLKNILDTDICMFIQIYIYVHIVLIVPV